MGKPPLHAIRLPRYIQQAHRRPATSHAEIAKGEGHYISGIYLQLFSEEELDESEGYQIALRVTMEVDDYGVEEIRKQCQEAADRLAALFLAVDGVEVIDDELCDEASMSLDDLRFYLRWDVDDLSIRDENAALAPDR